MLENGVIEPSSANYAAPLIVRKKRDGTLRPVIDYRELNKVTDFDPYPLPTAKDLFCDLQKSKHFAVLDLYSGYWQIPMDIRDKPKTTMTTPFGSFQFRRMPFGLKNAAQCCQRTMNEFTSGLKNCKAYIDDVIVHGKTEEELLQNLKEVFTKARQWQLRFRKDKTQIGENVEFLGHNISRQGMRPLDRNTEPIRNFPPPKTKRQLRRFIGMLQYYRQCIPRISQTIAPLTKITSPKHKFTWGAEEQSAFDNAKQSLINASTLSWPKGNLTLTTDASDKGIAAELSCDNKPVAFASRMLNPAETRYATFDKELLAIVWSVKHFHYYLAGQHFHIRTDHRPLQYLDNINATKCNRIARWLETLSEYSFTIQHIKGHSNNVADALSRTTINAITISSQINWIYEQEKDKDLQIVKRQLVQKVPVTNTHYQRSNLQNNIVVDINNGTTKLSVPIQLRFKIMQDYHTTQGHPGSKKTKSTINDRFYWPHMSRDIKQFCNSCTICQRCKVTKHNKPTPQVNNATKKFEVLHIDITGPFPTTATGNRYVLSMIDKFTRWVELAPIPNMEATTVAKAFFETWLCRYGAPSTIVSDQGTQFESSLFKTLCELSGIIKCRTTPYHPQSNGSVERMHRTLKTILRCTLEEKNGDWESHLQPTAFSLRTTLHCGTQTPPALLMFGQSLQLPPDISYNTRTSAADQNATDFLKKLNSLDQTAQQNQRTSYSNVGRHSVTFRKGDYVWTKKQPRTKLQPHYIGPFEVSHAPTNSNHLTIKTSDSTKTISSYNAKKCTPITTMQEIYQRPFVQLPQRRTTSTTTSITNNNQPITTPITTSNVHQPTTSTTTDNATQPDNDLPPKRRRKPNKHSDYVYF